MPQASAGIFLADGSGLAPLLCSVITTNSERRNSATNLMLFDLYQYAGASSISAILSIQASEEVAS